MTESLCCCGLCHVRTGLWGILVIQLIFSIVLSTRSVGVFCHWEEANDLIRAEGIATLFLCLLWLILNFLAMSAINSGKAKQILPHWIFSVFIGAYFLLAMVLTILSRMVPLYWISVYIIASISIFWMSFVEYTCFLWMRSQQTPRR